MRLHRVDQLLQHVAPLDPPTPLSHTFTHRRKHSHAFTHKHLILMQQLAARAKQDRLAKRLLQNGNRFGRQHVVFQARHAYPAYVVKYSLKPEGAIAKLPVVRVQSSVQCISVTVAGKNLYSAKPREMEHSLVLVKMNYNTLAYGKESVFKLHQAEAGSVTTYLSSLTPDEIVVVAAPKLSVRTRFSPIMADVLRSLRSIGGSLHFLDCPYVLVGAKQPHLLTGLVHEDHQSTKAAVEVDLRVIRYNRDTPIAPIAQSHSDPLSDMNPVRWQQGKRNSHGVVWEDFRQVGPQLTAAYQAKDVHVVINGLTVDLPKMKVRGGPMIRCLNSQGEILAPITPKSLRQTDVLSSETAAQRLLSKEVIRVKHAPDMNFMESVRHFTFLLSEQNLGFVNGRKSKEPNALVREVEACSETIEQALATYSSIQRDSPTTNASDDDPEAPLNTEKPFRVRHSSRLTADMATEMFQESRSRRKSKSPLPHMIPINDEDRDRVIEKASRCLRFAHNPARAPMPGAEAMTKDQVC